MRHVLRNTRITRRCCSCESDCVVTCVSQHDPRLNITLMMTMIMMLLMMMMMTDVRTIHDTGLGLGAITTVISSHSARRILLLRMGN